jgi:hypothetical protein
MKFTKTVFWIAAIYGIILLIPMYFLMNTISQEAPPAISHPEFYYGFVSVTLLWQCIFVFIALDPLRYREIIRIAILEKFSYTVPVLILYSMGKVQLNILGTALADPIFATLFIIAYFRMKVLRIPRSITGFEEARTWSGRGVV